MAERVPPLGYLLKDAQALLHTRMEEALRPLGLGVSQYVALHLMHLEPGISASELARRAFVTRQSMSAIVLGLLERGLVERELRGGSGRALSTAITGIGRDALRRAEVVVDGVETRMLSGLDPLERDALRGALTSCIDGLAPAR
jgi:DNA-binding MarR family transcriptional regulator